MFANFVNNFYSSLVELRNMGKPMENEFKRNKLFCLKGIIFRMIFGISFD